MSQSRQLAAIMFTDIAGYTSLMEKDEQKAIELLKINRELQKSNIEKYRGRWIKEMGDGVLASFSTVTDAVMCAGAIQKASEKIPELKLRIGIHLGEVVFENNDVFGDGVNIASRLQALAPVGGIFVSEAIYKNVINKKEIFSEFIREEILKNVSASVKIYEVKVELNQNSQNESSTDFNKTSRLTLTTKKKIGLSIGIVLAIGLLITYIFLKPKQVTPTSTIASTEKSIAVLPFVNMSNDPQQEYFSDGLSEELINMFTKIPGLKVIGRTSSFAFKGKNEDLRTIGQKLGVEYLLEGSVRKSGNKIRITTQLIKVDEGTHLWSETFDKEMTDIFKVQDQISSSVSGALRLTILASDKPLHQTNVNTDAYNDFLQGKYYYETNGPNGNLNAMKYFKEAIAKDSTFSLPWTYLSMIIWRGTTNAGQPEFKEAKEASLRALQLDPSSGIATINIAEFLDNEYDFQNALEKIEQALKLEPENPYVLRNAGRFYTLLGRKEESIKLCKKAMEIDPIQTTSLFYLIRAYYYAEYYNEAYDLGKNYDKSELLNLDLVTTNLIIQLSSQEESRKIIERFPVSLFQLYGNTIINFKWGKKKESNELLNQFIKKYPEEEYVISVAYARLDMNDKAIDWLEKAYKSGSRDLTYINVDPAFKGIRNNVRFQKLLQLMNFPK